MAHLTRRLCGKKLPKYLSQTVLLSTRSSQAAAASPNYNHVHSNMPLKDEHKATFDHFNHCVRSDNVSNLGSSAFDPFYFLHKVNVLNEQNKAFRAIWEENPENVRSKMTKEEEESINKMIKEWESFEDVHLKMRGIMGPRRHRWIRKTRTFNFVNDAVRANLNKYPVETLIFNDHSFWREYRNKFLNDPLLKNLSDGDLRYLVAAIAIDIYGGPTITLAFGRRKQYHFIYPNHNEGSFEWLFNLFQHRLYTQEHTAEVLFDYRCMYFGCLCGLQAIKEGKQLSPKYFEDILNNHKLKSCLKQPGIKQYAMELAEMHPTMFNDFFDRAFNDFQTDIHCDLRIRYETDAGGFLRQGRPFMDFIEYQDGTPWEFKYFKSAGQPPVN